MSKELTNITNYSPLDEIKAVMLAEPGVEAVFGLSMPPEISLFESGSNEAGSVIKARVDHLGMQNEMTQRGIQVFNMREIIGQELAKKQSPYINSEKFLGELRRRAQLLHNEFHLGNLDNTIQELETIFEEDKKTMGEDVAIAINSILTNCTDVHGNKKEFDINIKPPANFLFWRDTNHITGNEVRTHKMFYNIREQEVILAEIGLRALGIEFQRLEIPKKNSIEGGDVLPVEINGQRYAFIGSAERTSNKSVDVWFKSHEELWEQSKEGLIPAVINGPTSNTQDQMHLDTYFQQVGKGAALHCGEISDNRKISFLMRRGSEIVRVDTARFSSWIEKNFTNVYRTTRTEQLNYAPNILVDGGHTVYVTRADSPNVTKFIRENVSEVVVLSMNYLTKMYGGAHCSTSEIREG